MAKRHRVGSYAFLIGFILAVLLGVVMGVSAGLVAGAAWMLTLVIIVLGLIVGLVNLKNEHITEFLIAVIAVAMIGVIPIQQIMGMYVPLGTVLGAVLQNIVAFSAPAALVLGLKQVWFLGYSSRK